MKTADKYQVWLVALVFVFSLYLDWIYEVGIRDWLFKGVQEPEEASFSWTKYSLMKLLLVPGLAGLYFSRDQMQAFVQTLVITMITLPNLTYFAYETSSVFIPFVAALLPLSVFLVPRFEWQPPSFSRFTPYLLAAVCIGLPVIFMIDYGFAFDAGHLLMTNDIYEARARASGETSRFTAYTFTFASTFLFPLAALYFWHRKGTWRLASIGVFVLAVCVYTVNPHKSIVFNLGIVAFFALFQTVKRQTLAWVGLLLAIGVLGRFESLFHTDTQGYLEGFFIRRVLFLPAMLNDAYFTFFDGQPVQLAHSVLRSIVDYPYEMTPSKLIGNEIYGTGANANNGLLSDGFMNFGIWGAVSFSVLPVLFLTALSRLRKPVVFSGMLFLVLSLFKSSALLTSILSHGLLWFTLLWIFFIPSMIDE